MKEAIYQCTPYIGVGKVKEALDAVHDVFVENQIELPLEDQSTVEEETRFQAGFDVQSEAFGREYSSLMIIEPQELKIFKIIYLHIVLRDFYTRQGLDLKIREMFFCYLATLGGCHNQLRAHTMANIQVGNVEHVN